MTKNDGKFKAGNKKSKGNGRPTLAPVDKHIAKLTKTTFKLLVDKHLRSTIAEIKERLTGERRDELQAIEAMTLRV